MYAFSRYIYDKFPPIYRLRKFLDALAESVALKFDRLFYAKREFKHVFGRKINLKNPRNLIEKFYWLECNADLSLMTRCADKYAVRGFVTERGCGEILNTLYAKWDQPEEIDLSVLPDSFILKTNNGSGDSMIVRDKGEADDDRIRSYFRQQYDKKYGRRNAQFHYCMIEPCIIAEKLLAPENTSLGASLVDYKVWCFDGTAKYILVIFNRQKDNMSIALYDTGWNPLPQFLNPSSHYQYHPEIEVPEPESLDEMLKYASVLSEGFPEVRVDFYEVEGKPVFGEMTFTTGYGYFTDEFYDILGDLTKLDR